MKHRVALIALALVPAVSAAVAVSAGAEGPSSDTQVADITAQAVLSPPPEPETLYVGQSFTPAGVVANLDGAMTAHDVLVTLEIGGAYAETLTVDTLLPNQVDTVDFPGWTAVAGTHRLWLTVAYSGDPNPLNDQFRTQCFVLDTTGGRPQGVWVEVNQMPLPPSGKLVKHGGWLAIHDDNDQIYAAKGYKTTDFYAYDPLGDAWSLRTGMPYTTHPLWSSRPPYKGGKGVSDGGDYIYVTQGNNTLGFWRYRVSTDSWEILPDIPIGPYNKKVKGGTDLVHIGKRQGHEYIYLLKGYRTEFYRFDIDDAVWETLQEAPVGVRAKWSRGSFLVDHTRGGHDLYDIYAHKSKYNELWRYDAYIDSWDMRPLTGMPLVGISGRRKKSKDGGCGVWFDDMIFALKGGNTDEFWAYEPLGDSWVQLEPLPQLGSTGKSKRVKYGADLVLTSVAGQDRLYALKGNKTNELWYYGLLAARGRRSGREGVMAGGVPALAPGFALAANPVRDGAVRVRYSLPRSGHLSATVVDPAGRVLLERSVAAGREGVLAVDARSLNRGVYLLRLESGGLAATRKLVLQ